MSICICGDEVYCGGCKRVRVLEGALREVVRWGDKLLWSIRSDACGWIYGIAKDALTPAPPAASHTLDCNEGMTYGDSCSCAPPAETPAPTYKHGIVEIGACLSCVERDRLRAEIAAANEEIARLKVRNEFVEREWQAEIAIRKASDTCAALSFRLNEQLTATTANLGRAVAAIREVNDMNRSAIDDNEGAWDPKSDVQTRIDDILADADR
jgi:hypothetical protein